MKIASAVPLALALLGCAPSPSAPATLVSGLEGREREGLERALQSRSGGSLSDRALLGAGGEAHRKALSRMAAEEALSAMAEERRRFVTERQRRDADLYQLIEREAAERASAPPPPPSRWKRGAKAAGTFLLDVGILALVVLSSAGGPGPN